MLKKKRQTFLNGVFLFYLKDIRYSILPIQIKWQ